MKQRSFFTLSFLGVALKSVQAFLQFVKNEKDESSGDEN